jgi:hypothetical protein
MKKKDSKKIKPEQKSDHFKHNPEEVVYQVSGPPIEVAPGETVDILIPGPFGFSVYLPIAGHFNAQVFEAVENPEWALEKEEKEMVAVSGSSPESTAEKFWGVRMTRISEKKHCPSGKFPYCIYSKELNNFAVGNSPPEMILDP